MSDDLRFLTDSYGEGIRRINEIGAELNFVFITDMHSRLNMISRPEGTPYELAADAIRSIQYIIDRCPGISFVVSGGDMGADYLEDSLRVRAYHQEVMDALYGLSLPVHCCVGNHDDVVDNTNTNGWSNDHVILPDEMHRLCMKNNPTDKNYYYFDHESGFRFVFLDVVDHEYNLDENGRYAVYADEISEGQCRWLENEALKTDRKIIVFSHAPLDNTRVYGTAGYPRGFELKRGIINGERAYRAVYGCKNVVAFIFGHVHYDNMFYDREVLTVSTLCAFAQEWAPSCPRREIGTPTETAFDVFSIKGDVMYVTRFGAGYDRQSQLCFQRETGF